MLKNIKRPLRITIALLNCCIVSVSAMELPWNNALPVETRVNEIMEASLYKYVDKNTTQERDWIENSNNAENEAWIEHVNSTYNEYQNNINNILDNGNIYNFYCNDEDFVCRADVLEAIMKVIGLTDDMTSLTPVAMNINTDVTDSFDYGSVYAQNYIWSASKTVSGYKYTSDENGCGGALTLFNTENNSEYIFYPKRYCTIKEALMFIARAIDADNSTDHISIALDNGICDADIASREDEYITVSQLRGMLINLYAVKGDVYYDDSYDGSGSNPKIDTDNESTYYEKYKNMHTFIPYEITENELEVSAVENGWGTKAVKLRDIMMAHDVDVAWDNGKIKLTDSEGTEYITFLDRVPGQVRLGSDNILCMELSKEEAAEYNSLGEINIVLFGQYEMIDDSVYLYPQALFALCGYLGIDLEMTPEDLSYSRDEKSAYNIWTGYIWTI